jgi:hypothetical protein
MVAGREVFVSFMLMASAMPRCQSLGFSKDDQVFELQKILQFHLVLGKQPRFLFLGDKRPHSLASPV